MPFRINCSKTMRSAQIAGDAAECPLSLFANPGRNRVPKTVDFGQLAVSSKTLWLRNVSEPLNGERFRDPKLRREVRLKVNAVAKAVRWLDGADAECWEN
jgi:hypothetical protein